MTIFDHNGLVTSQILIVPLLLFFTLLVISDVRHHRLKFVRVLFQAVLCVYLWTVFDMTLFPINISRNIGTLAASGYTFQGAIDVHPLAMWYNWRQPTVLYQLAGNGLMLLPLTLLCGGLSAKLRPFWRAIGLAFGTSLFIETSQLVMNYFNFGERTFDLNDLLLNTLGGLLGWILLKVGLEILQRT